MRDKCAGPGRPDRVAGRGALAEAFTLLLVSAEIPATNLNSKSRAANWAEAAIIRPTSRRPSDGQDGGREIIGKDDSQVHRRTYEKEGKIYHFYLCFLHILVSCRACVCIDLFSSVKQRRSNEKGAPLTAAFRCLAHQQKYKKKEIYKPPPGGKKSYQQLGMNKTRWNRK